MKNVSHKIILGSTLMISCIFSLSAVSPSEEEDVFESQELRVEPSNLMLGTEDVLGEGMGDDSNGKKGLAEMINEYVEFGGAIEVEAGWGKKFNNTYYSDIALETAELDFEITVTDCITGMLGIEWVSDDDLITVKEAYVTFGDVEKCPQYLQVGRIFVPFGTGTGAVVGDTLTISDPLTIEIFETREDVILFGYKKCGFQAAAYAFNGETNRGSKNDHIENWGATLRYEVNKKDLAYNIGVDFINSVFDSIELKEEFPEALGANYAPGFAVHGRYFQNGFSVIAEYNGAFDDASFVLDEEELNLAPKAWQVELGYQRTICCRKTYVAVGYSESYDLHGKFPENRFLVDVGVWLNEGTLIALEYGYEEDYSVSNGGTGRSRNFILSQLVYEW